MAQRSATTSNASASAPASAQSEPALCNYCYDFPGTFICTGCRKVHYCSKQCQERSWEIHIFDCDVQKPIKTFHHLARAIRHDLLPTDRKTLDDWGFNRADLSVDDDGRGMAMLFGLYTGLVRYMDIPVKTLGQWRKKGTLLAEIKKVYEALPEGARGGYYPWLLKNEFVLDTSLPPKKSPKAVISQTLRDGWIFSGGDRFTSDSAIQQGISSMPEKKRQCVLLCGMLLNDVHPSPTQVLWLNFGFCIGGQYSEICAGRLYRRLVASAPFQEILHAFETCGMVELFRKKGLTSDGDYRMLAEEFEDVMSGSGRGLFKSSWRLKQFIQVRTEDPTADIKMRNSVRFDYGFVNCTNDADVATLTKLYQRYFRSDSNNCVHLHNACIKGELFEYLGKFLEVPLDEQQRRLLKNVYPLAEA